MTIENIDWAMELKLLRESIWKIEDKFDSVLEGQADQTAELIRVKNLVNRSMERLTRLEQRKKQPEGR